MSTVLRLRTHELHDALAGADVLRTVVDEMLWREVHEAGAEDPASSGLRRVGRWILNPGAGDGYALLRSERSRAGLLLPASGLRAIRGAALTAAAARIFLAPSVVTVAVLGHGVAAQLQIAALAWHVPGVSHIAVHAPDGIPVVSPDLAEELELSGIGLTVTPDVQEAVLGANLIVLAGQHPAGTDWDTRQLPEGAVVVNASGHALPNGVPAQVREVYVDDRRLPSRHGQVAADLGQVLAGSHPGRDTPDDVVLVDLLGVDSGGVWLTYRLYEAALAQSLGVRAARPGTDSPPPRD